MKNLVDKLIKESKGWKPANSSFECQDFSWSANKEFFWMSTEGEQYGFLSKKQIEQFKDDFDDEETVEECLALEPGEMYDADGGINIYIRIK